MPKIHQIHQQLVVNIRPSRLESDACLVKEDLRRRLDVSKPVEVELKLSTVLEEKVVTSKN